jgi:hypothetical protein
MFLQIFVPVLFAVSARLAQGALRGVGYEELSFTTVFADLTSTANAKSGKSMPWLDKLKTMTKLKDASFEACPGVDNVVGIEKIQYSPLALSLGAVCGDHHHKIILYLI